MRMRGLMSLLLLQSLVGATIVIESIGQSGNGSGSGLKMIRILIYYGDTNNNPSRVEIPNRRTSYSCSNAKTIFKIYFEIDKSSNMDFELNTSIDSSVFTNHKTIDPDIKLELNQSRLCFVYGTWWPSGSEKFEMYLNFLSKVSDIELPNLLYLKSIVKENNVGSIVMIIDQNFKIVFPKKGNQVQEIKEMSSKEKEIKDLIAECSRFEQKIIGNSDCQISKDSEVQFQLGVRSISQRGNGELNMIFFIRKIEKIEEKNASDKFAEVGTTPSIETKWAKLACRNNGIEFTLAGQNLRLLSDGAGTSKFVLNKRNLLIL